MEPLLFSREWSRRTDRFPFLKAVLIVFGDLARGGMKPSSTYYVANHKWLGQHAMPRILREWSRMTGLDATLFPWTDAEVATTWEEWRKTNAQYRAQYLRQVGLEPMENGSEES